ncbi:MAG: 3-deoxy-7-phosphoheptulonate synthase [Clostridia bacterium]
MIIVMKNQAPQEEINRLIEQLSSNSVEVHPTYGKNCAILGLVGDVQGIQTGPLEDDPFVERILRVAEPYKLANKKFQPQKTIVKVGDKTIGDDNFTIMAGPCAVESREQLLTIAAGVKLGHADILRGGAFKPRSSPYSFQGLGDEGIKYLQEARAITGLPIVTELMAPEQVGKYAEQIDMIQIGARNIQNFDLLKEVGNCRTPVLLKRGLSTTLEELLMSAEYILSYGNRQVVLCERGIRTFETATRNTLDISAVPVLKQKTHLPVIIDPSHSGGLRYLVEPLSLAAAAVGADGVIVEVHNNPRIALCDGAHSLFLEDFAAFSKKLKAMYKFLQK